MNNPRMKGISPLIAAVLLIAVTMTLAGVLAYWASTFVQSGLESSSNQTIATQCNFGNFVIDACSYDNVNQRVTFILDNVGTVDLYNITVFVIYPDNNVTSSSVTGTIGSGTLKSFSANGISPGFSTIRVRTQCPNVFEETVCR